MAQVRTLSKREQDLLALKFDAELTYGEIARVMGMSEVNVRVAIFRAIRKLRQRMNPTAGGAPTDDRRGSGPRLVGRPEGPAQRHQRHHPLGSSRLLTLASELLPPQRPRSRP